MQRAALIALLSLMPASCGGGSSSASSPTSPSSSGFTLTVTGVNVLTAAGQTYQLTTTRTQSGTTTNDTSLATYQSSNPAVATVNANGTQGGLVTAVANGSAQITATEGTTSASIQITVNITSPAWTGEGNRFSSADFGSPGDGSYADAGSITLPSGGVRLVFSGGGRKLSESSPDGLAFSPDPGVRTFAPRSPGDNTGTNLSLVHILRLDDGSLRLYGSQNGAGAGQYSAISTDQGLTWAVESGVRLTTPGLTMSGFSVVRQGGVYRAYYGAGPSSATQGLAAIYSASSSDGLSWTVDAGVRVAAGATLAGAPGSPYHPAATLTADGSVLLAYNRSPDGASTDHSTSFGLWTSTSRDGLSFTNETWTNIPCNDPELVSSSGLIRMYYDGCPSGAFGSARRSATSTTLGRGGSPLMTPMIISSRSSSAATPAIK